MHLEKALNDLEEQLHWIKSSYDNVRQAISDELKDADDEITNQRNTIEQLEEQNELLEEQVEELTSAKIFLELELLEVTNQLIQLRHELDISRQNISEL